VLADAVERQVRIAAATQTLEEMAKRHSGFDHSDRYRAMLRVPTDCQKAAVWVLSKKDCRMAAKVASATLADFGEMH